MFLNALKPDTDDGGDIISDDNLFTAGADCDCPIACDETVYSQELSVADLRRDSIFFDKLQDDHEPTIKLLEKIENITKKYPPPLDLPHGEDWDLADMDSAAQNTYFSNLNR